MIKALFVTFENPENFAQHLLIKMCEFMSGDQNGSNSMLDVDVYEGDTNRSFRMETQVLNYTAGTQYTNSNQGINNVNEIKLSQVYFLAGEVALNMVVYIDMIKEHFKVKMQ